jgi:hypothetical protein
MLARSSNNANTRNIDNAINNANTRNTNNARNVDNANNNTNNNANNNANGLCYSPGVPYAHPEPLHPGGELLMSAFVRSNSWNYNSGFLTPTYPPETYTPTKPSYGPYNPRPFLDGGVSSGGAAKRKTSPGDTSPNKHAKTTTTDDRLQRQVIELTKQLREQNDLINQLDIKDKGKDDLINLLEIKDKGKDDTIKLLEIKDKAVRSKSVDTIRRLVESIKEKKAAEESATKLKNEVKNAITRLRYAEVTGVNERGVEDCCISFKPFYRNDTVVLITGCECGKCMLHSDEGEKVIVDIKRGKTKKCFLCNTKISGFIRTTVANSATDRVWDEIQTLTDCETVDQVKERHEAKIEQDDKEKTNQIRAILGQR